MTATVTVTNTDTLAGKTVVQLYVGDKVSMVLRPVRETQEQMDALLKEMNRD